MAFDINQNPADVFMSGLKKKPLIPAFSNSEDIATGAWTGINSPIKAPIIQIEQPEKKQSLLWSFLNVWNRQVAPKQEDRNIAPVWSTAYNIGSTLESAGNAVSNYISEWAKQAQNAIKPALENAQNYVGYRALWDKVKEKYPWAYDHLDSALVWKKTIEKYPEYSSYVDKQNQTPFSDHPIASIMSYAGKNLIGWLNTIESWVWQISETAKAPDALTWLSQYGKGVMNLGLWSLQTASNILPQWQWAKILINPLANTALASNEAEKIITPINEGISSWIQKWQEILWFDPNSQASKNVREIGTTWVNLALMHGVQKWLWLTYDKVTWQKLPQSQNSIDSIQETPTKPYVDPNSIDSISDVPVREYNPKTGVISESTPKQIDAKTKAIGDKWVEEIYQAVNPTTRENKAVLRQRVNDLLPYIDENNMFNNDLPKVKERVDTDMNTAFRNMEDYETNVWVKWTVETAPIIKALKSKYQEKIGNSYLNPDEAIASQRVIDLLKWFGEILKDWDILKVRRAWDDIIKANKGFMQSADANIKGEVFNESNKFLRDEIRKSNPEYANYLDKAHKTITLSDVLDATIQRRTGQTQWGFLRQWLENVARTVWTWLWASIWGVPWAMVGAWATEALLGWVKRLTWSSAKLTNGKKLILKSEKYGISDNNLPNSGNPNMVAKSEQLTKWSWLETKFPPWKKVETNLPKNEQQVIKTNPKQNTNLVKSKGGFIKISWVKSESTLVEGKDTSIKSKVPKSFIELISKWADKDWRINLYNKQWWVISVNIKNTDAIKLAYDNWHKYPYNTKTRSKKSKNS